MPYNHRIHDPYAVFRSSTTPVGLYARQKWLGESSTPQWKDDFAAAAAELVRGQSTDGLWQGSVIETIHRLFGLHLTVRHPDPCINKCLDALLKIAWQVQAGEHPFAQGTRQAIILPATLFLCDIFGRSADPAVVSLYDCVISGILFGAREEESTSRLHNIMRALVVYPRYADHPATRRLVDCLADRQTPQGDWGADIPFYQALNALAHLDTPAADRQTHRAINHLYAMQHADRSWGVSQRQWNTFLVVHALRNKGIL